MKTKLLLFSALAFAMLCFNGCTPDEVVTAQEQFKPLIIKVTLANPIHSCSETDTQIIGNALQVQCAYGLQTLNGLYNNQVGQNQIIYNATALSNQSLTILVGYNDFLITENPVIYYCNTVTTQIIFDGQVVYEQSRDMGSQDGTCGDGFEWYVNLTLP